MRVPIILLACIIGPIRTEVDPITGGTVVTHLQKYSRCGFLLTWPFGFHIWFFWKKQQQQVNPGNVLVWIEGSEQGIYARTPGYRYDAELGMKWTNGYIGGHWD